MSSLQIHTTQHTCGESQCDECIYGYPRKCGCGGLVHAEHVVVDVSKGGSGFKYLCDNCRDRFLKQPVSHDNKRPFKKKKERKKS